MFKNFIVILYFCAFFSVLKATPNYNNPWFTWRSLTQAEKQFNLSKATLNNKQCVFSNNINTVVFNNGSRIAELDGIRFWLNVAPEAVQNGKNWRFSAIDIDLLSLTIQSTAEKKPKKLTVMIDAGHGGSDPGAISTCGSLKEKDIVLDIALKTGKLLKKAGLKVLYTRKKDRTLTLNDRSTAAYKKKADLFVSIHANKAFNINASGIETFVLTPSGYSGTSAKSPPRGWQIGNKNDYNSNLLGYTMQKKLIGESETVDRGLKRQSFFVLRETYCPATLVEIGFLSNVCDIQKMKSKKWRSKCAEKLSEGVLEYCRRVDSLETSVAAKRKRESEANQRWRAYLTAKKNKQTEADLNKTVINAAQQPLKTSQHPISGKEQPKKVIAAQQELGPPRPHSTNNKQAQHKLQKTPDIDLNKLTENSVHAVATNIYLTQDDAKQSALQKNESNLKSLMEFYE